MAKKSFLLVSLKESKAKKLAEVISNKTCRKILDHLAEKKDATESQMAKDLGIPISTVHYNLKALLTAKLVKSDEYHYSTKGKEVSHYRLANQYVIIAPEGDKKLIREKLKSLIPTLLITGFAAGAIKMFSGALGKAETAAEQPMLRAMEAGITEEAAQTGLKSGADQAAPAAAQQMAEHAPEVSSAMPEIALWFFIGAVSGVAIYLIIEFISRKLRERKP